MAGVTLAPGKSECIARELARVCPGAVEENVSLGGISRWRIGGPADVVVRPRNIEELARLRAWLSERGVAHVVIGATSNLLFADEGLRAVCVQITGSFGELDIRGDEVRAGAGVWVPGLARRAMQSGLTGLEHICGIPGTLGGLICMNGGSQRRGIGDATVSVVSVSPRGDVLHREREACGFAYRTSVFQHNDEVVAGALLRLEPLRDPGVIRREMLGILRSRRGKFPRKLPNCGSVFVSDPAMYADYGPPGAVIERLGFKGRRMGGAQVSPQHANFIINTGAATAADVRSLISEIKSAVVEDTGYSMAVEARYVTPEGAVVSCG